MIYLDTSALVKLVFEEEESAALAEWVAERVDAPKLSSDLSMVELLRLCRQIDETSLSTAARLLEGIDLLPVSRFIIEQAAAMSPNELPSLDAIHLASAISVKDHLIAFVAYDNRLSSAALHAGLVVEAPR